MRRRHTCDGALVPHAGNLFREKIPAASQIINGGGMIGRDDHRVPGLPIERVLAILRAHGRGDRLAVPPVGAE